MSARRLFGDDSDSEAEPTLAASASMTPPLRLRLFSGDDEPDEEPLTLTLSPQGRGEGTGGDEESRGGNDARGGIRTTNPATSPAGDPTLAASATLRGVLERFRESHAGSLKPKTWGQYLTLVTHWETFHTGPGPSVAEISQELLREFFHSVTEWNSPVTWRRCNAQIGKLLNTCCAQSRRNKLGMSQGALIASIDDVPFVVVPEAHWFKQHRLAGSKRSGGHAPKRRGSLPVESFQKVIDACWQVAGRGAGLMETSLAWIWFSGMRFEQTLEQLAWCEDGLSDGIDLETQTLVTAESKCGGEIRVPIPAVLLPGLRLLRSRGHGPLVFYQPGWKARAWRKCYRKIWERAFPCATDTERSAQHWQPHQLRSVSCSIWDMLPPPACTVGWMVTGHRPGSVRQAAYVRPPDALFKSIVNEQFPMPFLHAVAPLFD